MPIRQNSVRDLPGYEYILRIASENKFLKGFVDFEFHPHFTDEPAEHERLVEYKRAHMRDIYACKDGAGLHVTNDDVVEFGSILSI